MLHSNSLATLVFKPVAKALLRLNFFVWVFLALSCCVAVGAATGSEGLFLFGTFGIVALPLLLGVIAVILLPFQ